MLRKFEERLSGRGSAACGLLNTCEKWTMKVSGTDHSPTRRYLPLTVLRASMEDIMMPYYKLNIRVVVPACPILLTINPAECVNLAH